MTATGLMREYEKVSVLTAESVVGNDISALLLEGPAFFS